jgi:tryptophan 7-halogenase
MKIAIVGTGTVGVMSVCHFLKYTQAEIHCLHNPKKNILGIGESSNIQLPQLLWESVRFNPYFNAKELDMTIKYGVRYKNWRKNDFISPILPNQYAIHFDNFKLSEVIFKKCEEQYQERFKQYSLDVETLSQNKKCVLINNKLKYDYVIDCRGYPEDYSEYHSANLPLNHCFVYGINKPGKWGYTYHHAHKHGWMFGIPLQSRQGWGYLFNDRITPEDEALDDLSKIHKIKLKKEDVREFKFKPYSAKKYLDGRILKNGNRAIFFEPLEALSGAFYDQINRQFFDVINKHQNESQLNIKLNDLAKRYINFISYIYHGGSIYKTKFWKQTVEMTRENLNNIEWQDTLSIIMANHFDSRTWPFYPVSWEILDLNLGYGYIR